LILFYTGKQRLAPVIEDKKLKRLSFNTQALKRMGDMVIESLALLSAENFNVTDFGNLLHEGWETKKSLSTSVSDDEIDQAYTEAMRMGAIGGKILGAGGGGFLLIFAKPSFHDSIKNSLRGYVHVPFKFEKTGSTIALYQPNGL